MDKKADQIKQKIKKLNQQLQKIEQKQEKTLTKLIKDESKNGTDIRVLAGMIINAKSILQTFSKEMEDWEKAGEKFLFGAKNKSSKPKDKPTKK